MGASGDPRFKTLISVQATYPICITPAGVLTCDDVIKVPLAYAVDRQTEIDRGSYRIIPVVELAIPLEYLVFEIITNEGVTVEPFSTFKLPVEANPYNMVRSYFVLPSGTTGIKGVNFKPKYASTRVALQFGVLPPPYNYDTALFGVITSRALELERRVDALENRQHYVNRVGISDSPDFFVLPGSEDHTNVLGWEFTFSNGEGRKLTLTYHSSTTTNTIFRDIDITGSKLLALAYNSVSSVCNLYALTESTDGSIITQRLIASGFGQIIGVSQPLHLFIDNVEQNAVEIGTGFEVFI